MAQFDLPLPEITVEDFQRSWIRFELVAGTKEWDEAKRKLILPSLLQGKLVDIYVSLDESTRGNLEQLKTALMKQAGLVRDPLTAPGCLWQGINSLVRRFWLDSNERAYSASAACLIASSSEGG